MREKDVHKLIEQQDSEMKQRIWARVSEQTNVTEQQPKQRTTRKVKPWQWATLVTALVCVVTLSVVLPLTLNDGIRYCDSSQYTIQTLDQPLGEYFSTHNLNLLYVDWYDKADYIDTQYGYNKHNPNDIFFFTENILNGETGELLTIYVTDNKTRVDVIDTLYDMEKNDVTTVKNVSVQWTTGDVQTFASFEYQRHIYYLWLEEMLAQDRVTEIIEDMLS